MNEEIYTLTASKGWKITVNHTKRTIDAKCDKIDLKNKYPYDWQLTDVLKHVQELISVLWAK